MATGAVHVPAWRKIGLRLVHEADDSLTNTLTTTISPPVESSVNKVTKRKFSGAREPDIHATQSHTSSKKRRIDTTRPSCINATAQQSQEPHPKKTPTSKQSSKSVTFAADTKASDSDSSFIQTARKAASTSSTSNTATPNTKEVKRLKRAQRHAHQPSVTSNPTISTTQAAPPSSDAPAKPYILYLRAHHNERDRWKFNKGHQNQLLKYIFDLYKVPPSQDEAVHDYIAGLQGEGVRQRLRADAEKILAESVLEETGISAPSDQSNPTGLNTKSEPQMDSPIYRTLSASTARSTDLSKVKNTIKESFAHADDSERARRFPELLAKRQRAESILEALKEREGDARGTGAVTVAQRKEPKARGFPEEAVLHPTSSSTSASNGHQIQSQGQAAKAEGTGLEKKKRSRGRKRRRIDVDMTTGVPDDDIVSSSSSSSSSSSPSSSESDDGSSIDGESESSGDDDGDTSSMASSASMSSASVSSSSSDQD